MSEPTYACQPPVEQLLSQAESLSGKFQQSGKAFHIDEAISLVREALAVCTPDHPASRAGCLDCLARYLWNRFGQLGGIESINEAIDLEQEALKTLPSSDGQLGMMINLAIFLKTRYEQLGDIHDLDNAIGLDREVLRFLPTGNVSRPIPLNNLALDLWTRYNRSGRAEDLDEAISLNKEALILRPPGNPDRPSSLINLALYLSTHRNRAGGNEDLREAIDLAREALKLCPPGHSEHSISLSNLSLHLFSRYNQLGETEDLCEAIDLARNALVLCPPGHPDRSMSLNNLASCLSTRLGDVEDLREAIDFIREALEYCPQGHPLRPSSLRNLASHLSARYNQLGSVEDLREAIHLAREELELRLPGNPERAMSLNNLALDLLSWYMRPDGGDLQDLQEAINLYREALDLRLQGDPQRPWSLSALSGCLLHLHNGLGRTEDIAESIVLAEEAISAMPPGHLDRPASLKRLADGLFVRYEKNGDTHDLERAIELEREILALRPPGHPSRSSSVQNLASHLSTQCKKMGGTASMEESFSLYSELARDVKTPNSNDLSAAKSWVDATEEFHHPSALLAYRTALTFLVQHVAVLPLLPQHLTILKTLSSSLAIDAFSACLRAQSPASAIELLEQGRSVFWTQLTRLRSPLDNVIASGPTGKALAEEFTRLSSSIHCALHSVSDDQHDRIWHLNVQLAKVVSDIRELPGHSRFLLPSLFDDLRRAASGGPIIVVNASKHSCDALVISVSGDPVHIPLSVTKEEVGVLSRRVREATERARKTNETKDLGVVLRDMWKFVVSPIADRLQDMACPRRSRLWWCPTAEFSLLPLHAAGPYRPNKDNFSDLYVSSYTPTLNALLRARRPLRPTCLLDKKRFVAIGQADAIGANKTATNIQSADVKERTDGIGLSKLVSVGTELTNVGRRMESLATFTRIEGEDARMSSVTEALGNHEWVHLACHGVPNGKEPFESAFGLFDGFLSVRQIIRCDLQDAEFAYLSACHTTAGDEESPDEVIHLAAAMQFAGFRSVIGTMWAVDDAQTIKITSAFYKHMVDERTGRLDHTLAGSALWKTMRSVNASLDQRVLYVHIGA